MRGHFAETLYKGVSDKWQDHVITNFLEDRFNCSNVIGRRSRRLSGTMLDQYEFFLPAQGRSLKAQKTLSAERCAVFTVSPSLVQHIGMESGVFGKENERMHYASDFPLKVTFPSEDAAGTWDAKCEK
jgi:hypothetical protein